MYRHNDIEKINSSWISSVEYHPNSPVSYGDGSNPDHFDVTFTFVNGTQFEKVLTYKELNTFLDAPSKGKYFNQHLK